MRLYSLLLICLSLLSVNAQVFDTSCFPPCPPDLHCEKGTCVPRPVIAPVVVEVRNSPEELLEKAENPYDTHYGKIISSSCLALGGTAFLVSAMIDYYSGSIYGGESLMPFIAGNIMIGVAIPIFITGIKKQMLYFGWEKERSSHKY